MINPYQLLTKQQAAEIRALRTLGEYNRMMEFSICVLQAQIHGLDTHIDFNTVVREELAAFFKSNTNITVTDKKQGQPAGFTLLERISWS